MIRRARREGFDQAWVLFDCWYLNVAVARELEDQGVVFVSKARKNTPVIIDGKKTTVGEWLASLKHWKRVRQTDHFFYQREAKLGDGPIIKLVATWFFRQHSLKKSCAALVTNRLSTPGAEVVLAYLRRWRTERGYRDWKRTLGGTAYRCRALERIDNYVWVGFIAYALANEARRRSQHATGLPTVLELRKLGLETMMPTRNTRPRVPGNMITSRAA